MSQETYEALMPQLTKEELYNLTNQQGGRDIISDFQLVKSNEAIEDYMTKEFGNNLTLAPGTRSGLSIRTPLTTITGIGSVTIEPTITFDAGSTGFPTEASMLYDLPAGNPPPAPNQHDICYFNNLNFVGPVIIFPTTGLTPTAIFTNCTFKQLVLTAAATAAHFHGCFFYDEGHVLNGGTAYILGGSRKSTVAHIGITGTFGETN